MDAKADAEAEELLLDALVGPVKVPLYTFGVRLGARMQPTRTHERASEVALDPGAAAEVFSDVIEHLGRKVRGETEPGGMRATLRGVITTNPLTKVPAVVDVVLEPRPGGGSRLTVRTTAKQSLAQRQVPVKAAQKLLDTYELAIAAPPEARSPEESA
jgi:hypothetical protein